MSEVVVLDSHVWYWWINLELDRLPPGAVELVEEAPRVGVSPVSCYELAWAYRRGRLELPLPPTAWFELALAGSNIEVLPVAVAERAVQLTEIHRDPFDRIIIATAVELNAQLVSVDSHFPAYPELAGHLIGCNGRYP